MNNKGQVLVIFIILIPIFLLLMALIINLGFLAVEKRNVSNNIKDALAYYIENIDDSNVEKNTKELINKNIKNIKTLKIENTEFTTTITVVINKEGIYNIVFKEYNMTIKYSYNKNTKDIIKG